ncbi:hypothetical protein [Lysinibacillus sp. G01H]|uniref:hypothetical protein n=1 Tax=Lysinibacillus sp. G01H TaxID=3026425 RepID=UPI00237D7CE2|nr:hypothetical protein [Lysinibacillus sp. G01H]WDU78846.1 hypothetical protein PSR12_19710 [Lysinibacillus sp. G01H]
MENIKNTIESRIPNISQGELFFLEVWIELTNDETHASYRPKVMNLKLILDELITYLDESIQGQTNFKHYVDQIAKETKGFLEKEKKIFNQNKLILSQFMASLENVLEFSKRKEKEIENAYADLVIFKKLQLFLKNNYKDLIIYSLKESIKNDEKKQILIFTSAIISYFISEGITLKKLYFCQNQLFIWENNKTFEERLDEALRSLNYEKKFTVFLKMTSSHQFSYDYPKVNDVYFYNSIDKNIFSNVPSIFSEISDFIRYAKVIVKTSDPHRASLIARASVEKALDFIMFTSVPQNVEFAYQSYVVESSLDSTLNHLYKHDYDSSFTPLTLSELLSKNNKLEKRSKKRLESSLKFFRMGLSTSTEHIAFTNTWTAIEYLLTGNKANIDIKKKMSDEAIKILSIDYISSLLVDLKKNLDKFEVPCDVDDDWVNVSNKDFLDLIRETNKLQTLTNNVNDSYLLKYRLEELSDKFKTNEKVLDYITEHNLRVEWQLSRIYRIRNIIAHEAHKSDVTLLLPHLRMYCFTILETYFRLIKLNENDLEDIDDLLIRIKNWYNYIESTIKDKNDSNPLYDEYLKYI